MEEKEEKEVIQIRQEDIYELVELPESRMGRPSKCTPEFIEEFTGYIKKGLSYKDACDVCGISTDTYYNWRKRAITRIHYMEQAHELGMELEPDPLADIFVQFYEAVQKAVPERKLALLERIYRAADDPRNWTAAAWYLERVHPEEFGRQMKVTHEDWRSKVIDLIKDGTVKFLDVVEEIGEEEAIELFDRAGKRIPSKVQSSKDNQDG